MNPPPRIEARSPSRLPWTRSVVAHTSPTRPVNRLMTVTSRSWSTVGWATGSAPAGATRTDPTSQIPFTIRTTPTYSSITPSSIRSSSVTEHPRRCGLVPVRQRAATLPAHHVGLVRAALLEIEQPADRLGQVREARRGEDPPGHGAAARARRGRARLGDGASHVEGAA